MDIGVKNRFWLIVILILLIPNIGESSEDSLYDFLWLDPDKSVYVLQNKTYKKKGSFFAEFNAGRVVNVEFQNSWGLHAKGGYYFTEEWGVDVFFSHYINSFNDNYDNIQQVNGIRPFVRRMERAIGATLLYTPFYGKVNTFNKIFYFDWGFGAGLSSLTAETNLKQVGVGIGEPAFEEETFVGAHIKTDFKVHINKKWHINLELRHYMFMAPGPGVEDTGNNIRLEGDDEITTHTDFIFGVGMKF